MSNKKPDEGGFSLLEVIVALSIMAVGFVTILQLFSGSIRSVEMSKEYLKGISLANHKLSELELIDFVTEEFSGLFKGEEGYSWELNIEPYESPLNKADAGIQVIKVKLRVFWSQFEKKRNVELVTLRTMGNIYPSTDNALLGEKNSSIYANIIGGGTGNISICGSETDVIKPVSPEENLKTDISGLPIDTGDISGFRASTPQVTLSGIGITLP